VIYFIQCGRQKLIKIGHSKGHPRTRMMTMQTGSPERLHLLGMAPGDPDVEAEWHQRFAHLRVRGEWFEWNAELRAAAKPHLHDPFGRKARQVALENGLEPYPQPGTRAFRNRISAMKD
jgi:hypothetical protein